ncbi:MAG: hypothetical protein JOZ42_00780 [Acetobacteraceae bacterium]|nr:hypothetical protein [Acetobacteraceae bacterium]
MNKLVAVAVAVTLPLAGCAGLSPTEQRALTGTGIGTAGGAVIGALAGNAGLGAGIGAVAGLGGGLLFDQAKQSQARSYDKGYAAGAQGRAPNPPQ